MYIEDTSYFFCRVISKMILENLAPYIKLVYTTLIILNQIGFVSPKNELEHGLATGCPGKCIKTQSIFQNSSKFEY